MIPHHSLAITRAERFNVDDVRVCDLAVAISEAQRREIDEMEWLIEDIRENRTASTRAEAVVRPLPELQADAVTECEPDRRCSDHGAGLLQLRRASVPGRRLPPRAVRWRPGRGTAMGSAGRGVP